MCVLCISECLQFKCENKCKKWGKKIYGQNRRKASWLAGGLLLPLVAMCTFTALLFVTNDPFVTFFGWSSYCSLVCSKTKHKQHERMCKLHQRFVLVSFLLLSIRRREVERACGCSYKSQLELCLCILFFGIILLIVYISRYLVNLFENFCKFFFINFSLMNVLSRFAKYRFVEIDSGKFCN